MTTEIARARQDVDDALAAAVDGLWAAQRKDGSWEGYLPSSAVSTAAVVIALHVADRDHCAALIDAGVDWICADQNADGGWADVPGGPSSVNATAIALSALNAIRPHSSSEIERGKAALEALGGEAAIEDVGKASLNVIVRVYLAFAGLWDPDRVKRIPIEIVFLPHRLHQRVSFILPGIYAWAIMQVHTRSFGPWRSRVNALAQRRALDYLRELLEFEGPDGGSEESAFMVALIVFGLALAGVGEDIVERYLGYLRRAVRPDGSWPVDRDLELSGTCYASQGLQAAGLGADPRLRPTVAWIKAAQRQEPLSATGCPPGGWGWAMPSSWPDVDDTSLALATLAGFGLGADDEQVRAAISWLHQMRNTNGSWGCFIRNGRTMFDAPCSALTAHAMMALNAIGGPEHRLDRSVRWLAGRQQPGGALSCVWFRDAVAGTAHALDALGQLKLADHPVARGCANWLLDRQAPDGGWGDGHGSKSSTEETAWALLGLVSADLADHPAAAAGAKWLVARQRADGAWDGSQVGYYYNGLTYWCDAMANGFAVQALARYQGR
jgi:squalene-hopene/tetraprenyl-beta-curcumene cyclase